MLYLQGILAQVIFSFLFIRLTVPAATSERFIDPPDGTDAASGFTYKRGALVQIVWQTDLERIALTLWHSTSAEFEYLGGNSTDNISNTNTYPWLVDSKEDISKNTFFFIIFKPGNTTGALQSQNFQIIDAPSGSTGAVASSPAASISKIITSTSPTSLIITPTSLLNHESSTAMATNSGISQSAKTGLGVGTGVGIPLLLAMGIYLGWKFHGRTTPSGSNEGHNAPVDTPINDRVERFQPANQENSGMRMNNFADSHQTPRELPLSLSRLNELYSTPIHQVE